MFVFFYRLNAENMLVYILTFQLNKTAWCQHFVTSRTRFIAFIGVRAESEGAFYGNHVNAHDSGNDKHYKIMLLE